MALDSIYKKRNIEELDKINKNNLEISKNMDELKNLINSLPTDNKKIEPDMDIKKIKEEEKREFNINTNNQNTQDVIDLMDSVSSFGKNSKKQDDSVTQSFEPFLNSSSTNSFNSPTPNNEKENFEINEFGEIIRESKDTKLEDNENFIKYTKELQAKHGKYYKAFMNDVEKEKYIQLLSNAYGYTKEEIENDLNKYIKDIEDEEDYKKILEFKYQQKVKDIQTLKIQANQFNDQIIELISYFEPYMNIPKVNEQISIIINKNNQINNNPIVDSVNDYKTVIEMKKEIIAYLQKAKLFIDSNVSSNTPVDNQDKHNYGYMNIFIILSLLAITLITFVIF